MRGCGLVLFVLTGCFSRPSLVHDDGGGGSGEDGSPSDDGTIDSRPHPPRCAAIDRPGLVAYYSFDEVVSGKVADGLDGDLDGTLDMAVLDTGKTNNAAHFTTTSANVRIGTHQKVNNLPKISVCAWLYLDEVPTRISAVVFDKSQNGATFGWNSYLNRVDTPLSYRVGFYSPFHAYRFGQNQVPYDQWFHMCTTWDGTDGANGIHLYFNGGLDNPANESQGDVNVIDGDQAFPLVIGRQSVTNDFWFPGYIDELVLYKEELGGPDVFEIYSCPTSQ